MIVHNSVLVLAFVTLTFSASACECTEIAQRKAFDAAVVVFRGTVVEINEHIFGPGTNHMIVTFRVAKKWKGQVDSIIRVHTKLGGICGGYIFKKGTEYVLYAPEMLDQNIDQVRQLVKGAPVYDVGLCILRIRTDVDRETAILNGQQKR